ncbi:gamma-glutamyltransferase (plasmid) [Streptomyces sp. HUAS TT11]|uniref:gamma-glutamyltransferase n=1 Tax=Streptomyces sp. HUAS TT11 TaxID=3447508 RepID=UPI003F656F6A
MTDFSSADDVVVHGSDAVDVPVLVRGAPDRRPTPHWKTASTPWPNTGTVPPHGWYLVTTTWREILKHAASVGRDATPWIVTVPQLAFQELLARITPLQAYLTIEGIPNTDRQPGSTGRRLVPSVVHTHGAERSARGAFGYRLGMTMAQWLCCGRLGLPATRHVESWPPAGLPGFDDPKKRLPDLTGRHPHDTRPWWLIEAKAGLKIGLGELSEGAQQLISGSALMGGLPHRLLLTGTSISDQIFMTLDDIPVPWGQGGDEGGNGAIPPSGPSGEGTGEFADDDSLLEAALDHLLVYLHLRYGSTTGLRVIPFATGPRSRRRPMGGSSMLPLEDDHQTRDLRRELRARSQANARDLRQPGITDFITAPVPGTGVRLGMSRRLFAACQQFHDEQVRILTETPGGLTAARAVQDHLFRTEDDLEAVLRQARGRFREREIEERERVRRRVRSGYFAGADQDWAQLLGGVEPRVSLDEEGLWEAAGSSSYVAVEQSEPLRSAARRPPR